MLEINIEAPRGYTALRDTTNSGHAWLLSPNVVAIAVNYILHSSPQAPENYQIKQKLSGATEQPPPPLLFQ